VVGGVTESETLLVCVTGSPFTVALAVIVRAEVATAWLLGAVRVRIDVWPAVMLLGTKAAVTPEGSPVRLNAASELKPLADVRFTDTPTDCPRIRLGVPGAAFNEKLEGGTMVSAAAAFADCPFTVTDGTPLAAPAGMMKVRVAAVALAANPVTVPPAWLASENCAAVPLLGSRFVPITVTRVPAGALFGLKSVIAGAGTPVVSASVPEIEPPVPFCTAAVKDPALLKVTGPAMEALVSVVSAALATVHGVHPGPLITIKALDGSKFVPEMASVNCWLATGEAGVVDKPVTVGPAGGGGGGGEPPEMITTGAVTLTVAAAERTRWIVARNAAVHCS
jgi:hypothetical protein